MKIAEKIKTKIDKIEPGSSFKYDIFNLKQNEYFAAAKYLERLTKKGLIRKISKGLFYKPKNSVFGELRPQTEEIIKPYLFKKGKRVAYITGTALYNKMGLTTQLPKEIKIASRKRYINIKNEKIKVTAVKSYVDVTDQNYYLLELLDAIKDFKNISDLNKDLAINILKRKVMELSEIDLRRLVKYSLSYPPRTRALLGAILEEIGIKEPLKKLKNSLNPLTKYKLNIDTKILSTVSNWNII